MICEDTTYRELDERVTRLAHALRTLGVGPGASGRGKSAPPTIQAIAAHHRERNLAAVVSTVDAATASGHAANSVEAEVAAENNDVLIPFGSVDPWQGRAAVRQVHRLVDEFGVRGFKFHPSMQDFEPNDRRFYPIYEAIVEAGVPTLFHTGQTGIGAGLPGGHGIKLRYCQPDVPRRRRRRLPRPDDHHGPRRAVGRRADLHRDPPGRRLPRPVRPVAPKLFKQNALRVLGLDSQGPRTDEEPTS